MVCVRQCSLLHTLCVSLSLSLARSSLASPRDYHTPHPFLPPPPVHSTRPLESLALTSAACSLADYASHSATLLSLQPVSKISHFAGPTSPAAYLSHSSISTANPCGKTDTDTSGHTDEHGQANSQSRTEAAIATERKTTVCEVFNHARMRARV